jgi:hypothetical protein
MKKIKLDINQKFGRLTTMKCLNVINKRNRILWQFKCDCGNVCEKAASDVIKCRVRSCGCLGEETKKQAGQRGIHYNTKPNKEGAYNKLYGNYKRGAKHRNYEWNLSKEQFKKLIDNNCYYCNSTPSAEYSNCEIRTIENTLKYNGIDRKDNSIGYTPDNCITACFFCNRMKMNLSFDDFINQIKTIYKNLNL